MMTQTTIKRARVAWPAGLALTYGALCYLLFFCTTLYTIGFVGDLIVPKSLDSGRAVATLPAILVNLVLLSLFAVQHSVMARPAFKRWWTRFVPRAVERSTYVLLASLALLLLYWLWLPLPATIWNLTTPVARFLVLALFAMGWVIVLLSTFLIDHFELFGLRQVYAFWKARDVDAPTFKTPSLYRLVRHPMMVGFLVAFWATPHLTVGHLLFSLAMTAYIAAGIHFEEHDLLVSYGTTYRRYQRRVRMLLPFPRRRDVPAEHGQPTSAAM